MLTAILKGKAGRINIDGQDQSWRDVFRQREDLLTSVFFGRLAYLSAPTQKRIIALLIDDKDKAENLGQIREVLFWEKLKGIQGRSHVEPDIILKFKNALVMIEVKPPAGGQQSVQQWQNEIEALFAQADNAENEWEIPETIYFVSLGNNAHYWHEHATNLINNYSEKSLFIHALEWDKLAKYIHTLTEEVTSSDLAVCTDWLEAFSLFGIDTYKADWHKLVKFSQKTTLQQKWATLLQVNATKLQSLEALDLDWQPLINMLHQQHCDISTWK